MTDDIRFKRDFKTMDNSLKGVVSFLLRHTGENEPALARLKALTGIATATSASTEMFETRCTQGADIAFEMGFSQAVADGISALDEHWDGGGQPYGIKGAAIPLFSRIALAAQVIDVFFQAEGPDAALSEIDARSGKWFDPEVVRAARSATQAPGVWEALADPKIGDKLFALEHAQTTWEITEDRLDKVVTGFARVVDAKSPFTHGHSARVATYTDLLTGALGYAPLDRRWMWRTALLHDIGKLGVSNSILDKPDKLTDAEFAAIKTHPGLSYQVLQRVSAFVPMAKVAVAHHERLDGKGYPNGYCATDLTQQMRILTVADIFDALSADRPYRKAMPLEKVFGILDEMTGEAVDGDVVDVLKQVIERTPIKAS